MDTTPTSKLRVQWYRCPVSREDLSRLNRRSDFKGFLQTLGFLAILAITGTAAYYSPRFFSGWLRWPVVVLLVFIHGTFYQFLLNGFHELVHDSVFKTRGLNRFFTRLFAFLGMFNHHYFWASHTEHHKYTLHAPDDLEVVLPQRYTLSGYLRCAFFYRSYWGFKESLNWARGRLFTEWQRTLFPESDPAKRRRLFYWSRFVLAGHAAIIIVSIVMHWWMLPVVTTFAPFIGNWLNFLCNQTQHVGLRDNVPDFRLCCRTVIVNPFLQFLYWHMNYHTEHHMYAAVPCYNLGKLHKLIEADMPRCPRGLIAAWKEIAGILAKQKIDPTYQYTAPVPTPGVRKSTSATAEAPATDSSSPAITPA
jgi:fatty acid desaturase